MKTFATSVFVLLLPLCLWAQIQYHDIYPDTLITAARGSIASFDLDMNDDGTMDFYFKHFNLDVNWNHLEAYTYYGQPGEVLVTSTQTPVPLTALEPVSSSGRWVCTASSSSSSALFMESQWCGKGDRYMGLRFRMNNAWHYGWIRINATADTTGMTIKDYAWETQPNTSILAGDAGTSSIEDTPKPDGISISQYGRYVSVQTEQRLQLHAVVYDLIGVRRIERSSSSGRLTLDLSSLPGGVYLLRAENNASITMQRIALF